MKVNLRKTCFKRRHTQIAKRRDRFCLEAGFGRSGGVEGKVAQIMYIHVSKYKNNKIKGERKKTKSPKGI
jgi:hypothetical protein